MMMWDRVGARGAMLLARNEPTPNARAAIARVEFCEYTFSSLNVRPSTVLSPCRLNSEVIGVVAAPRALRVVTQPLPRARKGTRLNSRHRRLSYAVFRSRK